MMAHAAPSDGTTTYELSGIDKTMPDLIMKFFIIYELPQGTNTGAALEALTIGIENAAEQIPIVKGNLTYDGLENPSIIVAADAKLRLNTRALSAEEHKSLSVLAQNSFHPDDLDHKLLLPPEVWEPGKLPRPVCFAQLNVIDGGAIFVMAITHLIADMSAIDAFISLCCRGGKAHIQNQALPNYDVNFGRSLFDGSADLKEASKDELSKRVLDYRIVDLSALKTEATTKSKVGQPTDKITGVIYSTNDLMIGVLKSGPGADHSKGYISTYDCICAILWRGISRARMTLDSGDEKTKPISFVHSIDLRHDRFKSQVPQTYFGNAVNVARVGPLEPSVVLQDDGVWATAFAIRRSIENVKVSSVTEVAALRSRLGPDESLVFNMDFTGRDLVLTSWSSVQTREYDFGFGAPKAIRTMTPSQKIVFIFPNCDVGSSSRKYEVFVALPSREQELLKEDAEFSKYFVAR